MSMVTCSYPGTVICPSRHLPGAKAPSSLTPNQAPNSFASATARQTRDRGARRTTFFSIRSVFICNLRVACYRGRAKRQPEICIRPDASLRETLIVRCGSVDRRHRHPVQAEIDGQLAAVVRQVREGVGD